jgi:hypothetical protein
VHVYSGGYENILHDEIEEFKRTSVCFSFAKIIRPVSITPLNEFHERECSHSPLYTPVSFLYAFVNLARDK